MTPQEDWKNRSNAYAPRRCKFCRGVIRATRENGEVIRYHINEENNDHEIELLPLREYTEAEKATRWKN